MASSKSCKRCGCTDDKVCVSRITGNTCCWILPRICSMCATPQEMAAFLAQQSAKRNSTRR
jgi:hypothetical protein